MQERLDSSRKLRSTGRVSRNNTPRRQNKENNSQVYSRRNKRKRSTGSRGKSKRTKRSDGDQGVVTTTAYQLPQFTYNEVVRIMCVVLTYTQATPNERVVSRPPPASCLSILIE